ncbi:MAG: hypothetical protein KIS66_06940 [Fimbriimonadaceae bacterium]|nr:hypothetical protein [Fimbriimonadaceae bacterium]
MPVTNYHTVNGRTIGETTDGVRTDYLTDALSSVTATVDQSQNVLNTYRYKPYGGLLAKTGSSPDPRFLWTGDTGSRTTGLAYSEQYNRARHYGSRQASWTSVDPLWPVAPPLGYVSGNPIRYTDPTGLFLNSCGHERDNVCMPPIAFGECCMPLSIESEAEGRFSMHLPERPVKTRSLGSFVLRVTWILRYKPSKYCPEESRRQATYSWIATTSSNTLNYWGGWREENGPIPPSDAVSDRWGVSTKCEGASLPGMVLGDEGYKFAISPEEVWIGTQKRDLFRLHPDGPVGSDRWSGSWGCIVFFPVTEARRLRSCLQNLRDFSSLNSFKLNVTYY